MALPNGDLITTVFDPQMAYPVDKRMQVDTLNSRDSISMYIRWEGMTVYVLENSKIYILQGGRSNEYWKELGTGTGTGGTTFVGQFETADLLPTTGRSAGDYAFVGTGEDFVQYNWDSIANEWVMAEGQTDLASEHFHIGYKTPLRRPVIFRRDPEDIIITDSGDIIIDTQEEAANFILTGEVTSVRGIISATDGREIKLINRTGSDVLLVDEYTSTDPENRLNLGGSDYTLSNGETVAPKSESDRWVLGPVNEVAFSDHLDSVNATRSIGPDGLEVIDNVLDSNTDEQITLRKVTDFADGTSMDDTKVDGFIYKKIGTDYFGNSGVLARKQITTSVFGILDTKNAGFNRAQLQFACDLCAKVGVELIIPANKKPIEINQAIVFYHNHSGFVLSGSGSGTSLKIANEVVGIGAYQGAFVFMSTAEGHPKNITLRSLTLDGNKENNDAVDGSGVLLYQQAGAAAPENQEIKLKDLTIQGFKGSGIANYRPGVTVYNVISKNNGIHGMFTQDLAGNTIIEIFTAFGNGGRGLNIGGGNVIANVIWCYKNTAGGFKNSDTEKLIGSNWILEDNDGVGFSQSTTSVEMELILNNVIIKNNRGRGIDLSQGLVKRVDNIFLINNNLDGTSGFDNNFDNCSIGHLHVENPNSTTGNCLYLTGNNTIENLTWQNNNGKIHFSSQNGNTLRIQSGLVKNNIGYVINQTGDRFRGIFLSDIEFVDTTPGNTQATAIRIVNDNYGSIVNCDFTNNPGPKVEIHQTSDVLVKDCIGFNHSAIVTNSVNYSFFKGDRHRYLRFTGNANTITVNADIFEAGDEIKGEIQGGTKTITAGAGVTLRGGELKVNQGQRFSIKFESPTDALVTVYMSTQVEKATWIETATDISGPPTQSFHLYNRISEDFTGSPDDNKDWFIRRVMGNANTVAVDTAIDRDTGQMFSRAYTSGAWTAWVTGIGFQLDANGNAVIDNTKKVGNGVANSENWIQYGNGANIYNVPTGQQHIFRQNGVTVAGISGDGKFFVEGVGKGIILKSPDGTQYEITVPDGGASLTITEI